MTELDVWGGTIINISTSLIPPTSDPAWLKFPSCRWQGFYTQPQQAQRFRLRMTFPVAKPHPENQHIGDGCSGRRPFVSKNKNKICKRQGHPRPKYIQAKVSPRRWIFWVRGGERIVVQPGLARSTRGSAWTMVSSANAPEA